MSDDLAVYVCGFLFREIDHVRKQVLLVEKTHPEWQKGLQNGIGGKVDEGEVTRVAMAREFREEAHYFTTAWDYFAVEHGPGYEVHFFRHTLDLEMERRAPYVAPQNNDRDEELAWVDTWPWPPKYPVIGNLNWLVPLALDPRPIRSVIRTTGDIRRIKVW